jgi:hypothetical protein
LRDEGRAAVGGVVTLVEQEGEDVGGDELLEGGVGGPQAESGVVGVPGGEVGAEEAAVVLGRGEDTLYLGEGEEGMRADGRQKSGPLQ